MWNLEKGSRNILRASVGGWLCHAEHSAPMLLWGEDDEARAAHQARKKRFTRAFTTAWAGTGLWGTGARKGVERPGAHGETTRRDAASPEARQDAAPPRRRAWSERELDDMEARIAEEEERLAMAGEIW